MLNIWSSDQPQQPPTTPNKKQHVNQQNQQNPQQKILNQLKKKNKIHKLFLKNTSHTSQSTYTSQSTHLKRMSKDFETIDTLLYESIMSHCKGHKESTITKQQFIQLANVIKNEKTVHKQIINDALDCISSKTDENSTKFIHFTFFLR